MADEKWREKKEIFEALHKEDEQFLDEIDGSHHVFRSMDGDMEDIVRAWQNVLAHLKKNYSQYSRFEIIDHGCFDYEEFVIYGVRQETDGVHVMRIEVTDRRLATRRRNMQLKKEKVPETYMHQETIREGPLVCHFSVK